MWSMNSEEGGWERNTVGVVCRTKVELLWVRNSSSRGRGSKLSVNSPRTPLGAGPRLGGRGFAHQGPGGALTTSPGRKSHGTLRPRPPPHLTSPPPPLLG